MPRLPEEEMRRAGRAARASLVVAAAGAVALVTVIVMSGPNLKCQPGSPSMTIGTTLLLAGCTQTALR